MGFAIPFYNLDISIQAKVENLIKKIINENFSKDRIPSITYRPIRPDEINDALTINTRVYDTTKTGTGFERIIGAANDLVVRTGSIYVFLGWIVVDDATASIGMDSVARIMVDGVLRNEIAPYTVNLMENNAMLTLDQIVVATEDTHVTIEFNSPSNATAHAIVYPLAFRIGPKAQLNVS